MLGTWFCQLSRSCRQLNLKMSVHRTAVTFVSGVNLCLLQQELDIEVESELREGRVPRTKRQPGELAADSRLQDAVTRFRVEVFRRVVDQVTTSIDERLSVNRQIIQDTASEDPRWFSELNDDGAPENSMEKLVQLTGLCASGLRSELLWFARNFDRLSKTLRDEFLKQRCLIEMNFVQIVRVKQSV